MTLSLAEFHVPVMPPGEDELPHTDGEPMETERHRRQMYLLIEVLEQAWKDRDDFYVSGNMALYFSETQARKNDFRAPDFFVVLDTTRRVRKSWVVWGEDGKTPDVVIELLSPTTEHVDRGEKMRIYARVLHVPRYFLFDPLTGLLEGYALDEKQRGYVRLPALPSGDVACSNLGLALGVRRGIYDGIEADWLRWLDAQGQPLPSKDDLARAAQEHARSAEAQARSAEAQARSAEAQARSAEARADEQARLRAEAERKLAEALAELARLKGA
jgi:Uma2 family endonuclease